MRLQSNLAGVLALSLTGLVAPALAASHMLSPAQQSAFQAHCVKKYTAQEASAAKWAPDQCKEDWKIVTNSLPAADLIIAALPKAGENQNLAQLKQKLPMVKWLRNQAPYLATGTLGDLTVHIDGPGTPGNLILNWTRTGEMIPFNIIDALRQRGAKLTMTSCEKLGTGEGNRSYAGALPGHAPFNLSIDQRTAPTGDAMSYYGLTLNLTGKKALRNTMSDCDF